MIKSLQSLYDYPQPISSPLVKNYPALNSVKGILVVLIIITHSLPESMTLYFLYMFHMPVFLGISGFLLKESSFKNGLASYFGRITKRLIIPWLIAFAVYLPFQITKLTASHPFEVVLYPFYHLWYIPAYLLGAVVCFSIYKWKLAALPPLIFTGFITLTWYVYFRDIHVSLQEQPLYWMGDKRLYCYLFFFILGYGLRNNLLQLRFVAASTLFIMATSFLLIVLCIFQHLPDYFTALPYLFFNLSLILFLVLFVADKTMMQHRFWLYINSNSLGIYFYHPLILILVYKAIGDPLKEHVTTFQGILIGLLTVGLCVPLTLLMNRFKFSKRFMLGNS